MPACFMFDGGSDSRGNVLKVIFKQDSFIVGAVIRFVSQKSKCLNDHVMNVIEI